MSQPILSIGIIFKNEIRCLERCLKSFQALREAVLCELVMADTGSDDGSRAIAEKYADILIDFPWIDDFAAARNAVMDRCSGFWYLTVDADEWLDEDIAGLIAFLKSHSRRSYTGAGLIVRNYVTDDFSGDYNDFFAIRIVRMDTGVRYNGAIHERWDLPEYNIYGLSKTILHHDGYVWTNSNYIAKQKRNMDLLEKKLAEDPNKPATLMQCVESSSASKNHVYYARRAARAVLEKREGWEEFGPPILRYAANATSLEAQPDFQKWVDLAKEWFPNSPFTTIDVAYLEFCNLVIKEKYAEAIPIGESYLHNLKEYNEGCFDIRDILYSTLMMAAKSREEQVRCFLASAYFFEKQYDRSKEMLDSIDASRMEVGTVGNYLGVMLNLHAQSEIDMSLKMAHLWEKISAPVPNEDRAEKRKEAIIQAGFPVFPKKYRNAEDEMGFHHAYTIFLLLEGKCTLGDAAAMLETYDPHRLEEFLERQEQLGKLPYPAFAHALECGVRFPLPDKPLSIEESDGLASRLAKEPDGLFELATRAAKEDVPEKMQALVWLRGLTLTAVQAFDWKDKSADEQRGLDMARLFARTEKAFLSRYYSQETLQEENLLLLSPLHRFGWYCVHAFEALDAGDAATYVRLLRKGLKSCESVKNMVEFLIDHTPEVQVTPPPSDELKALADKVRMVLANFAPDDPAVTALKQSDAYQKVAYLIEGINVPVVGGLLQ